MIICVCSTDETHTLSLPSFIHCSTDDPVITLATNALIKPPVLILPPTTLMPNSAPGIEFVNWRVGGQVDLQVHYPTDLLLLVYIQGPAFFVN